MRINPQAALAKSGKPVNKNEKEEEGKRKDKKKVIWIIIINSTYRFLSSFSVANKKNKWETIVSKQ